MAAAGGVPVDVLTKGGVFRYPVFLPDGRRFVYTNITSETGGVFVGSLDGTENRRLLTDRSAAIFAPSLPGRRSGHLLFVRENNLMAMPFDAGAAQPTGNVFPVAENVSLSLANAGYAPVSTSDTGVLLHWSGMAGSRGIDLTWYDRAGKVLGVADLPNAPGEIATPAISPDEKRIAFTRFAGGVADIWLRDLIRASETRLTIGGLNFAPSWSPNGDRVLYTSSGAGAFGAMYLKAANGSNRAELLFSSKSDRSDQGSRDGRFIVFTRMVNASQQDIWVLPTDTVDSSDRKPLPVLQTPANELHGQLSPDSRWMAYTSDESGQREVYVRQFPEGSGRWKISTAGGEQPRWRGDGHELFYVAPGGTLTAVEVRVLPGAGSSIEPSVAVPLFDSRIAATGTNVAAVFNYDVTADGKRFLVVATGADAASAPPLTVVVNWTAGRTR